MSTSRVLVTGAAGLIGSACTRILLDAGHAVIACDDFSVGTWREGEPRLVWETADVAAPDFGERLARHAPDVVVHGAAHPGGRSSQEPTLDVRVNVLGSMQVFEWCARNHVPVVYLSSSIVYGEHPPEPIHESARLQPGTIYAACKVACENFLRVLEDAYGLEWTVLRLFPTYGAGHRPGTAQGIVNVLLTQLLAGDGVVVRGSLDRVRDLLYVDDAAAAIAACTFKANVRGKVFNVGTGRPTTIRQLLGALCAALGIDERAITVTEAAGTPGDPYYNVADVSAFAAETGIRPAVSLDAGLARLVAARRTTAYAG